MLTLFVAQLSLIPLYIPVFWICFAFRKQRYHTQKMCYTKGYWKMPCRLIAPKYQRRRVAYIQSTLMGNQESVCEIDDDCDGWIVIQRRLNGEQYFYRGWEDYKTGFGNLTKEFWLGWALSSYNGKPFTTKDRDNDEDTSGSCAVRYTSGWWFHWCHNAYLNGMYFHGYYNDNIGGGVTWLQWRGNNYSLMSSRMMIRKL